MDEKVERLTISVEVMNEILAIFGNMPYTQSAAIIEKIKGDVRPVETEPNVIPDPRVSMPQEG
jgi:hypothetical protein